MTLIDPAERCPLCFSADFVSAHRFCVECTKQMPLFDGMAAAFDYMGPAATLVKKMKYGDQPYLGKGGGAFLAAQWTRLKWPYPDFIIPVPISWMRWLERGYNQSQILCESLSEILKVPMVVPLKRCSGDYSQAALSRSQRMELGDQTFKLRKKQDFLRDKILLLVDDVMTTGKTLRHCASILMEACPTKIYALVLCNASFG